MFSKAEAAQIRQEFWTSFGKSFPRKWILYNTKIKGFSFKFVADTKKALVVLDVEHQDEIINQILWEQLLALKSILLEEYVSQAIFDDTYQLENGKIIKRIYITHQEKFSIHNKETWRNCFEFFKDSMPKFEDFFNEYQDVLKHAIS